MEGQAYQNPAQSTKPLVFDEVFQLVPGLHRGQIGDALDYELNILCAMLLNTHGASFEGFNTMCDTSKDSLLHGVYRSAVRCAQLAETLHYHAKPSAEG